MMSEQHKSAVRANQSLVLNGDFMNGFSSWHKGDLPNWLSIASDRYEGESIRLLSAGNGASVSQILQVPKEPGDSARYVLSFLCETWHTEPGRLVVAVEGQSTEHVIPLPPAGLQHEALHRDGRPMVFVPIEYSVRLDEVLGFTDQDTLKISVFSPPNASGDYSSAVRITRIKLHLELEPLVIQAFKLDEQSLSTTEPLPLCLGASGDSVHRLEFVPALGNAWVGTRAAVTSEDNPQGAVLATPPWGEEQPLDVPWAIDCPLIGGQAPYLFSMNLLNQYTAEPYAVPVSLGHHRLKFSQVSEAAYYPVLEYEQSVRLGVLVASYYTDQPLSGRTVTWSVAAQRITAVAETGLDGWAYFDFQPNAAGDIDIQVSVDSPYYASGNETRTMPVRVLATDPWKDVRAIVEGTGAHWEAKTGYPNRGSDYAVELTLPNALIGTDLSLRWSGDSHEQLGVEVSPALDVPIPVAGAGLTWALTSEDRLDGLFYLELACSKLALPSPKKTMSLARNLVKVGEVREANKSPVVDENESVLLRVQAVHVRSESDGDPVVNALVEWITPEGVSATVTGDGGWASVLYAPTSAGNKVITAHIKAHAEAVAVTWPFNVTAIATSPWNGHVNILLDGEPVERNTLGVLCRRGQTHALKIVPVSDSAWIGRNISLHWRGSDPDIGLVPGDLGTARPLVAAGVEWSLGSQANTSTSSLFDLELRLAGETTVQELSGRLVAVDLAKEVSLRLDQIDAVLDGQALYPCLGALHRFSVVPNALSPLVGLTSRLTWSGASAEDLGATVEPALEQTQPVSDGGAIWALDFTDSGEPGEFALALELPQLDFIATAKPMRLDHNKVRIQAWRDSPVEPVAGLNSAWVWVQVVSHFSGRGVAQVPVTWTAGNSSVATTDADGWAGFAVQASSPGAQAVTASLSSPYDGYREHHPFEVTALAGDPWADLKVSFDGAEPHPWGQKTYFPRRSATHRFKLTVPANNPLLEGDLTLGMTGTGPAELGITFLPEALGVARQFDEGGLHYTFTAGDLKDGSFALRLASQRLASLSPPNAMSLGEGTQVVDIIWESHASRTLDWEQELVEGVSLISSTSGKPVAGVTVTWQNADLGTLTTVTDYYGMATLRFVPTTPGAAQLRATVGSGDFSRSVTRAFFLNEPRRIASLLSEKTGGHLGEQVSAMVTVVSANTEEPLLGIEVLWTYPGLTLEPTVTDAQGQARATFRLTGVRRGLLETTVKGGYAGWEVKHVEFELVPNELTWLQEFRPYVNNREVRWPDMVLTLTPGQVCILRLDYEYSWLIGEPDAQIQLEFKPGEELQGLVVDPPLGQLAAMATGTTSLSWSITAGEAAQPGIGTLQFGMPAMSSMPKSPPVSVKTLAMPEVDVAFDEMPVVFGGNGAYPCHGATHRICVKPKTPSRLSGMHIRLVWGGEPAESFGAVITPALSEAQLLTDNGVTWELDCSGTSRNVEFTLRMEVVELEDVSEPLVMSLGHNLVTAARWSTEHPGSWPEWIPYEEKYIRATSVHLRTVAPGVRVLVNGGEGGSTDGFGVYSQSEAWTGSKILTIVNQYNGSLVP